MNEIIAALIIACSNLTMSHQYADKKGECVQRVSVCAEKITHAFAGDLDRAGKVLKLCSPEVHL
jgi:hypothetical protein